MAVRKTAPARRDDLQAGTILRYRGDAVPYVTPFLRGKGEKLHGKFLLPMFEDIDGKRDWYDVPGVTDCDYEIVAIETARTGKKGKPLGDLYLITCRGFRDDQKVGLLFEDVCVKFEVFSTPAQMAQHQAAAAEQVAVSEWAEQARQFGW